MVTIEMINFLFTKKIVWFSETPFDVKNCDAVFFYACKNDITLSGFKKRKSPTIVIDLLKDYDELWKGIGKSTRRYIKQGQKNGIELQINKNYDAFLDMFVKFARKKQFKAFPFSKETMKNMGTLFTAELNGKILSGMLAVEDSENIRALLGGSIRFEVDEEMARLVSRANKFIIWKILEYAKNRGYKKFDFGGYYGGNNKNDPMATIDFFKRQFGGEIVSYYNYEKYYSKIYSLIKSFPLLSHST